MFNPTTEELAELKRLHENVYVYAPTPQDLEEYRVAALNKLRSEAFLLMAQAVADMPAPEVEATVDGESY